MNRKLSPAALLTILTGLNLFNYMDRYVMGAVLHPIQQTFGIGDGAAGRMNTAFMLGYFVTAPFFGWLGDRASRKWLVALGIFIWSLGTLFTGFASSFLLLLCFRVLVGVGEASYATISPSLISDSYSAEKRNNALTIFYVAIPVGAALGYILGGEMEKHYGWRYAFIWAGVPGLALALILLPFREPLRGGADGNSQTVSTKPSVDDVLRLFKLTKYQLIIWGYVAYTFALGGFANWGPTYLNRIHHVPVERAATFFGAVTAGAGLFGTFLGGFAASAWHKRNPAGYALLLGWSVLAAVPVVVVAFVASNTAVAMSCLALAMLLIFLSTGPVNTLIIETVPINLRASAMAISIFMIHLFGDLWSPEIVGRISDATQSLQKGVMILPAALLVGAALWLTLAWRTSGEPLHGQIKA
jgi:predicted MFS family arabinose efflux permease